MDQPTVVYGFAKEGGGYSLGEMKIKLAKEGLAMYSPSTKCQDNEIMDFGSVVDHWLPIDFDDFSRHGKPEVMITEELLTMGDFVWRLYEIGLLDSSNSKYYNAHRNKTGVKTKRAIFSSQPVASEGVVADSQIPDNDDLELGSEFSEEGIENSAERQDEEELRARRVAEELDELKRVTAEDGLDQEELEIVELTVSKERYNAVIQKCNSQAKVIHRALRVSDNMTERVDCYVKGDAKITNQQMAVVVKASVEPLMKVVCEVKKGIQDFRMDSNSQVVNFVKSSAKKQEDQAGVTNQQLQLILNTVRNLLPARPSPPAKPTASSAPAAATAGLGSYPSHQGQGFQQQGFQQQGFLGAPPGFPGPPPSLQAPPTFPIPPSYNQAAGTSPYSPAPVTFQGPPPAPYHGLPVYQSPQPGVHQQGHMQGQQPPPGSSHFYQVASTTD